MSTICDERLEEIRKYVYERFGIPAYVAENPDITTQKQYFMYQFPIDFEPPKIMEADPWPLRNPYLNDRPVLDEYRDKAVYGRFCEAKAATTNVENSGQV